MTNPEPGRTRPAGAQEPLLRQVVGEALRRVRRAQDRTLRDVADAAGISMPYLSEIERGRKEASSEMLAAVAGALGLTLVDVLTLTRGELTRPAERRGAAVRSMAVSVSVTSALSAPSAGARGTRPAARRDGMCLAA